MPHEDLRCCDFGRSLKTVAVPGFELREAVYPPATEVPRHLHPGATLCLVVAGGFHEDWGGTRVPCGPASLVFHPPGEAYGDRISDDGSRCVTVGIDPGAFVAAAEAIPAVGGLRAARVGPPWWLAFQLSAELELDDDLTALSVEQIVFALLAELGDRPGLEARRAPPAWLQRVAERIHEEFARALTLDALAETAGVHRVHLAREFRRHYGCTVGECIRQRRVELACHRLISSGDRLSDIAFDAGFADQSHLTNTFRRLVGITPAAFRARFSDERSAFRC